MPDHAHHSTLLTEEFFKEYYVKRKLSFPKIREELLEQGHNIAVGTLWKYAKNLGINRNQSEARSQLDQSQSFLTPDIVAAIDGFMLGDGGISKTTSKQENARLRCGLQFKEFAEYLMKPFDPYLPEVKGYKDNSMKSGIQWQGSSKHHPDLYLQWLRWYPEGGTKQPPNDVRITPLSTMMWYLGDGSFTNTNTGVMLRLSTDGFSQERVEFLVQRLESKGLSCHRDNENRILFNTKGIPAFFDFIGRQSPVSCYDYKFDLPEWRFKSKRMREVVEELGCDYQRFAYLVKIGKIPCFRASEKGRPRFMPEHIEIAKTCV